MRTQTSRRIGGAAPRKQAPADDARAKRAAIAEGRAALAAGRAVPHEDVERWLQSWGKPDELPAPKCK
jgi:predicted transcriptional regulator